jgi:hypothetical protein
MKIIELIGTLLTVIGFYLISEQAYLAGFAISMLGSFFWLVWSVESKAHGIFVINAIFVFVNLNGILGVI